MPKTMKALLVLAPLTLLVACNDEVAKTAEIRPVRTVAVDPKPIDDDPDGWYCYTAITFVDDRVVLAHCAGDNKVGRLNLTQITSFDLGWLYQ